LLVSADPASRGPRALGPPTTALGCATQTIFIASTSSAMYDRRRVLAALLLQLLLPSAPFATASLKLRTPRPPIPKWGLNNSPSVSSLLGGIAPVGSTYSRRPKLTNRLRALKAASRLISIHGTRRSWQHRTLDSDIAPPGRDLRASDPRAGGPPSVTLKALGAEVVVTNLALKFQGK